MTQHDRIITMTTDELARYFACGFPTSPCNICKHDHGPLCTKVTKCTQEYRAQLYKTWLESNLRKDF